MKLKEEFFRVTLRVCDTAVEFTELEAVSVADIGVDAPEVPGAV